MTNSKKITIILCSILFAFVGLFGIFLATNKDGVVKADSDISISTYSYKSGSLPFYVSTFTANDYPHNIAEERWLNFSWSGTSGGNLDFSFVSSRLYYVPVINYTLTYSNIVYDEWTYIKFHYNFGTSSNNPIGVSTMFFQYYFTTGFNFNVVSLRVYSERWGGTSTTIITTRLIYTDSNNKTLSFILFTFGDAGDAEDIANSPFLYTDRIYYLTGSLSDNQYFEAGRQQGLADNQSNIYDEGYNKAIEENKSNWEQTGYNRGIQDANDYTFLGLIGATIDAPISALFGYIDHDSSSPTYNQRIGGFFNFELLGINLKDFFFAVLTFAVVIVIVRFCLGK